MNGLPPKIDSRKMSGLLRELQQLAPHYAPEWASSDDKDPGKALLAIFAHLAESVVTRLNQVPHKNFVAFLDMLGIRLLPAQSSRVPLMFTLAEGTQRDVLIPAKTQAAAAKTEEHEELPFETERSLLATTSNLKEVVSVDPLKDHIYIHTQNILSEDGKLREEQEAFTLFSGIDRQEHSLYLGHTDRFNIEGTGNIFVDVALATDLEDDGPDLNYTWEYWGEDQDTAKVGWMPLERYTIGYKLTKESLDRLKDDAVIPQDVYDIIVGKLEGPVGKEYTVEEDFVKVLKDVLTEESQGQYIPKIVESVKDVKATTHGFKKSEKILLKKPKGRKIKEATLAEIFESTSQVEIKDENIKELKSRWIRCRLECDEMALGLFKEPERFIVSPNTLTELRKENIPANIIVTLEEAQGQEYTSEEKFIGMLESLLGREQTAQNKTLILKHARLQRLPILTSILVRSEPGEDSQLKADKAFYQDIPLDIALKNPPVIQKMVAISSYETTSKVVISKGDQEPVVGLESVDGLADNDPVTLIGAENIKAILSIGDENGPVTLHLEQAPTTNYVEGDLVVKGDGMPLFPFGNQPRIYDAFSLGSQEVFSKKGALVTISLELKHFDTSNGLQPPPNPRLSWEYWNGKGWQGLPNFQDSTNCLLKSGLNTITFTVPLDIAETEISGQKNYWIRARIVAGDYGREEYTLEPLEAPEKILHAERKYKLPIIQDLTLSYTFDKGEEPQQCLTYNNLDFRNETAASKTQNRCLHPFILPDDAHLNFYLGFDKPLSTGPIRMFLAAKELSYTAEERPKVEWNYYSDANRWMTLDYEDETKGLTRQGHLEVLGPSDFAQHTRFGRSLYWIQGNFKRLQTFSATFKITEQVLQTLKSAGISDEVLENLEGMTGQEFEEAKELRETLGTVVSDKQASSDIVEMLKYLNLVKSTVPSTFNLTGQSLSDLRIKRVAGGVLAKPVSLQQNLLAQATTVRDISGAADTREQPLSDQGDTTIPVDLLARLEELKNVEFENEETFLKALEETLGQEAAEYYKTQILQYAQVLPEIQGMYLNSTWAFQAETVVDEILGSSNGEPDQIFPFMKFPVLQGERVRVREVLSEEEKQELVELSREEAIYEVTDEMGEVLEVWVLWLEVSDFFGSGAKSRHYTLDRATGQLQFGNGENGMIPPAGANNIQVFSYQAGGGARGNVSAGEITSLKSSVAGVDKVSNPVAADNGADTATLNQMLELGPAMISHRYRAVTVNDFECLARMASRKVAKAKCLPNTRSTKNERESKHGWVTVIIVPNLSEDKPSPSLELREHVGRYLKACCTNTLASLEQIYIGGPTYVEIGVEADLFVMSIDVAFTVEKQVRERLKAFFHPLTGGPENTGWDFGRDVSISDIYALLEDMDGIDHVENLQLIADGVPVEDDVVRIQPDSLVATGTHTIHLQLLDKG